MRIATWAATLTLSAVYFRRACYVVADSSISKIDRQAHVLFFPPTALCMFTTSYLTVLYSLFSELLRWSTLMPEELLAECQAEGRRKYNLAVVHAGQ